MSIVSTILDKLVAVVETLEQKASDEIKHLIVELKDLINRIVSESDSGSVTDETSEDANGNGQTDGAVTDSTSETAEQVDEAKTDQPATPVAQAVPEVPATTTTATPTADAAPSSSEPSTN